MAEKDCDKRPTVHDCLQPPPTSAAASLRLRSALGRLHRSPGADSARDFGTSKYVRLVLNGHVHISKVQQERDIWYISNPSLSTFPCGFRLFHVSPQEITVETYQVSYPALVEKGRQLLATSPMAFTYNSKNQVFCPVGGRNAYRSKYTHSPGVSGSLSSLARATPQEQEEEEKSRAKKGNTRSTKNRRKRRRERRQRQRLRHCQSLSQRQRLP